MNFLVLGLNHKSAPLEIREKVSFSASKTLDALESLKYCPYIEECLILSTCNRVELYAISENKEAFGSLKNFLYDYHNLREPIDEYLYLYENQEAILHLFRVVSSLDSMMVGENQILAQVKQAYINAHSCGAGDRFISLLFQEALRIGKKVRTETNINKGAVSISSAAVELARSILGDLAGKKILIIGAGKVGELTVRNLTDRGIEMVLVANRTYYRAVQLAEVFNGRAIRYDEMFEALREVDIVISSTSAPHYILKKEDLISVMSARNGRAIFLIDLSLPRNIEEEICKIENVYLYNIDDLKKKGELNLAERLKEAQRAEQIVREDSQLFYHKLSTLMNHNLSCYN